jgi:hypothetical protein
MLGIPGTKKARFMRAPGVGTANYFRSRKYR